MTDDEIVCAFEEGRAPAGGFHHADHVRVAWCYLRTEPLLDALARFSRNLRVFAEAQGKPGLYHETITVAYVLLIAERLARSRTCCWEAFASAHPDLLTWKPSVLDRYYSPATLASPQARGSFVLPDLGKSSSR